MTSIHDRRRPRALAHSSTLLSMVIALAITTGSFAATELTSHGSLRPSAESRAGTPVVQPRSATPGQTTTVTGALLTRRKRPVVLQRKTLGVWSRAAKATTTRKGRYRFTTTAPSKLGTVTWRV